MYKIKLTAENDDEFGFIERNKNLNKIKIKKKLLKYII